MSSARVGYRLGHCSRMRVDCRCAIPLRQARGKSWAQSGIYRESTPHALLTFQFAGISALALAFAIIFVPELKGRSLEETDELFEMRLWAWQFNTAQTSGVGARIARLEQGNTEGEDWSKVSCWGSSC